MKNKGLVVINIFLLLSLSATIGYIIYDKMNTHESPISKTDSTEIIKEEKEEEKIVINVQEKDVSSLMRKINTINIYMTEDYPFIDIKDIPNQVILEISELIAVRGLGTQGMISSIDADKIVDTLVDYFGSDYQYKLENINCHVDDGVLYQYNAENNDFTITGNHGHDGHNSDRNKAYFVDAIYNKLTETYTINTKIVSAGTCGGTCGPRVDFYGNFNYNEKLLHTEEDTDFDTAYQLISEKIPVTTYTFSKNSGGDYGLKSVQLSTLEN